MIVKPQEARTYLVTFQTAIIHPCHQESQEMQRLTKTIDTPSIQ